MSSTKDTDLYAALGLTPKASRTEITRAYRALLREHHPDSRPDQEHPATTPADPGRTTPESAALHQEVLSRVMDAYIVLGDPTQRARYDHSRNAAARPPAAPPTPPVAVRIHGTRSHDQPPIQAGPLRWHP